MLVMDAEMKAIVEDHLDMCRRDVIESLHSAEVALEKFKSVASEAAVAGVKIKPSLTMVEAATNVTDALVSVEAGEWQ